MENETEGRNMKFLKAVGLGIVMMVVMTAFALAGEVATRTGTMVAPAANGGGTVSWTNNAANWTSAEVLYVEAWNMVGGNASTLTVYRVCTNLNTETLGTISGNVTTSNGILVLKTSNVGKDLVYGDKIKIDALATNVTFKACVTYKQLQQ